MRTIYDALPNKLYCRQASTPASHKGRNICTAIFLGIAYVFLLSAFPSVTQAAVSVGTNFKGLIYNDAPDLGIAAGPNHIVQTDNTFVAFYSKTGTLLSQQNLWSFFSPVGTTVNSFVIETTVIYDEIAGRFVIQAIDLSIPSGQPRLLMAVSNSSDPTQGWTEQHLLQESPGDGAKIGYNADAYVITFVLYGTPNPPTRVISIDKSSVLDANNITFITYRNDTSSTWYPASMPGSLSGDPMWILRDAAPTSIKLTKMTNVLSNAAQFTETLVSVGQHDWRPAMTQPGGTTIDAGGSLQTAIWRNNRLVTAQPVGIPDDGYSQSHVQWYEFDTSGISPTLLQMGTTMPGTGVGNGAPAIAIAPNGDIGLTYVQSSATEYLSMYVTGRKKTDPLNTMQTPVLVKAGEGIFTNQRTCDFPGIAVDAADGTFWGDEVYANTANAKDTWIANFWVGMPALSISNVAQNEGNSGVTSFVFTVTLSAPSTQTVTVNYATADGSATTASGDYASTSGTLTFSPGQTTLTFSVAGNGDTVAENDETFLVRLSNQTNAGLATREATGTIQNDDLPKIYINDVPKKEGRSGSTPFSFIVSLSQAAPFAVTVSYTTADGTATVANNDYSAASGTLTPETAGFAPWHLLLSSREH